MYFPPDASLASVFQVGTGSPIGGVFAPALAPKAANACVGHFAQAGGGPASGFVLTAELNSGDPTDYLAAPTGFNLVWQYPSPNASPSHGTQRMFSIWAPIAPANYISMGMVGRSEPYRGPGQAATPPDCATIQCVTADQLTTTEIGPLVWFCKDGSAPVWLYSVPKTGMFLASTGAAPAIAWAPASSTYTPRMKRRR